MKDEKRCRIVQDLLPMYIDELCSDESKELVEEHLRTCDDCKRIYDSMKEGEEAIASYNTSSAESDEQLIKRVSNDINRRTGKSRKIAVAAIGIVAILIIGLFAPIGRIGSNDLSAKVFVVDRTGCEINGDYKNMEEFIGETLFINDVDSNNTSDKYALIDIPGFSKYNVEVIDTQIGSGYNVHDQAEHNYYNAGFVGGYSQTAIQEGADFKKLSIISLESNKIVKGYSLDVRANDDDTYTLVIKNPRTSLLNNTSSASEVFMDVELVDISKVVVKNGGSEEVLYER